MNEQPEPLLPLKTWSHLAGNRRHPSEYEIVSTNLLYNRDESTPPEAGKDQFAHNWHKMYRYESPLTHPDWDAFRDPDQIVYRTYNIIQDGQETYIENLVDEYDNLEHDAGLAKEWLDVLEQVYTPGRYLANALMMGAGYGAAYAQSSTIANCFTWQCGDALRLLSRIAYRTAELAKAHPDRGFGSAERNAWETSAQWQEFRELVERALVAFDVGEHFVALNLVVKPAVDEAYLAEFAAAARYAGDDLAALISDSMLRDSERSRRWSKAFVEFCRDEDDNLSTINGWLEKWVPFGGDAVKGLMAALPGGDAEAAIARTEEFRVGMGLAS